MIQRQQNTTPKYCFSYIRFSSKKQELGSSLERQEPIAERVAKEKGWIYRPEFNARSLGVSAYKGDNKKKLESIAQAARDGKIPQGTVMVIETLDRATRLELDEAQQLIRSLLKSGLEIYTDLNKRHLTAASLNSATEVMLTAVELDSAYQYSKRLSERSTKGFAKLVSRIENGERVYFGGLFPSYITGIDSKTGEFTVNKTKEKIIRRIFSEYLGGKSLFGIINGLNEDVRNGKLPNTGMKSKSIVKWSIRSIRVILGNQAYKGDFSYKGKVFKGYLPKLVSEKDFASVQMLLKKNSFRRGGSSKNVVSSIFKGIARCQHCEDSMLAYTTTTKTKKYVYYICGSSRNGGCKVKGKHWMNLADLELHFMMFFLQENPFGLIAKTKPAIVDDTLEIKASIAEKDEEISKAVELIRKKVSLQQVTELLNKLEEEKQELENELQKKSQQILMANTTPQNLEDLREAIAETEVTGDRVELGMLVTKVKRTLQQSEVRQKLVRIIAECSTAVSSHSRQHGKNFIPQKIHFPVANLNQWQSSQPSNSWFQLQPSAFLNSVRTGRLGKFTPLSTD